MRVTAFLFGLFGASLISAGVLTAHADEGAFYNPSNAASPTGFTSGYERFRTIGCPGRELLGNPCPVPTPAAVPPAATPEPAPPQKLVLEGVNFDFDQAVIRQGDMASLDRDVATLKEWGDVKVEVAGHTCSIGTDDYNMGLSQRRADSVRNYLIEKGVSADRLSAKGYGESQPVADNGSEAGRVKNRRVELVPLK